MLIVFRRQNNYFNTQPPTSLNFRLKLAQMRFSKMEKALLTLVLLSFAFDWKMEGLLRGLRSSEQSLEKSYGEEHEAVDRNDFKRQYLIVCPYGRYTNNVWQLRTLWAVSQLNLSSRKIVYPYLGKYRAANEVFDFTSKSYPFVTEDEFLDDLSKNLGKEHFLQIKIGRACASTNGKKPSPNCNLFTECWDRLFYKKSLIKDSKNLSRRLEDISIIPELILLNDSLPEPGEFFSKILDHDIVILSGELVFYWKHPSIDFYGTFKELRYSKDIKNTSDSLLAYINAQSTNQTSSVIIGAHIRLGDLADKVPEISISLQQIKSASYRLNATSVFICTNGNASQKKRIVEELKDSGLFIQIGCDEAFQLCHDSIFQIAVEQLTLSRVHFFMGSPGSSFSYEIFHSRDHIYFPDSKSSRTWLEFK